MEIKCTSTDVAYISKVRNMGMTKSHAVSEFVDGMLQKGASIIRIRIDNPNRVFTITGNGTGMSYDDCKKFAENFMWSKTSETDKNKISFWGVGTKDAAIVLSDIDNEEVFYSHFKLSTAVSESSEISTIDWDICRNEKKFQKRIINRCINEQHMVGTSIKIEDVQSFSQKDFNDLERFLDATYCKHVSEGVKIVVETNQAQAGKTNFKERFSVCGNDPLYLNILGDNINKDGLYVSPNKGLLHTVNTIKIKNDHDKEMMVKVVTVYVTDKYETRTEAGAPKSGFYVEIGGRRIEYGDNLKSFVGLTPTGGGMGRNRVLVILPEDGGGKENPFGLKPNKSAGVIPFKDNSLLDWYSDENGNYFSSIMKHWFDFGKRYYESTTLFKSKAVIYTDVANDIYSTWLARKNYKDTTKKTAKEAAKRNKKGKKPSSKVIADKAMTLLKKVDETDEFTTFYIVRDEKKFVTTDKYDETLLPSSHGNKLVRALLSNGVSSSKAHTIINDYISGLAELQTSEVEEFASSEL